MATQFIGAGVVKKSFLCAEPKTGKYCTFAQRFSMITPEQFTFDAQPCTEAMLPDLSLAIFESYRAQAVDEETIAANHRTIEEQNYLLYVFLAIVLDAQPMRASYFLGKNRATSCPGTMYSSCIFQVRK